MSATVARIADHPRFRAEAEPLVTKAELARHLAVSPRTIERWQRHGMPVRRLWTRRRDGRAPVRYRVSEVMAWLEGDDGH